MAKENSTWGYTRICGALFNLGHEIGRNTIKRILLEAGIDPAPERSKRLSWSAFLRAHWGAIAATNFFTVEVLTLGWIGTLPRAL
jgi:putative transposase